MKAKKNIYLISKFQSSYHLKINQFTKHFKAMQPLYGNIKFMDDQTEYFLN